MVDENIEFSDEEDYVPQEGQSIKTIVLTHIGKISNLCCQEFTAGYWSKKPVKTQSGVLYTETYHDDVRQSYCNAVDFLIDILTPLSDKDFKDYIKDNENVEKPEADIEKRLLRKRITFKKINEMFERTGFWEATGVANE